MLNRRSQVERFTTAAPDRGRLVQVGCRHSSDERLGKQNWTSAVLATTSRREPYDHIFPLSQHAA